MQRSSRDKFQKLLLILQILRRFKYATQPVSLPSALCQPIDHDRRISSGSVHQRHMALAGLVSNATVNTLGRVDKATAQRALGQMGHCVIAVHTCACPSYVSRVVCCAPLPGVVHVCSQNGSRVLKGDTCHPPLHALHAEINSPMHALYTLAYNKCVSDYCKAA